MCDYLYVLCTTSSAVVLRWRAKRWTYSTNYEGVLQWSPLHNSCNLNLCKHTPVALPRLRQPSLVTHTHTNTCTHAHTNTHSHTCTFMHARAHTHTHTKCTHTCTFMHACTRAHTHTHTHTFTHIHTHTHTNAHKHTQKLEGSVHTGSPIKRLVSRMERWMMGFIQNHGFLGIFLLGSWWVLGSLHFGEYAFIAVRNLHHLYR